MEKVSIIIPAHNEEKRIPKTLDKYYSFFENLKKKKILDFSIIVVVNNCQDNTLQVVKKISKKEIKILNFKQGGKGFAITEGFKEALKQDFEHIGFVDADMSTPPKSFYDLIKNIKNVDCVIANRWDKRSKIQTKQGIFRRVISRGFNLIVRSLFLFPYRDTQCGAKVVKRDILKKIISSLGYSEWAFDINFLFYIRKAGGKIKDIPTVWSDSTESHINLKITPVKMFLSVVRLRILHSPFKFVLRAYDNLPEFIKFHKQF